MLNFPKKHALKRKFKCDPHTFGGSRASVNLSKELNSINDPKMCEQVSTIYHRSSEVFKDIGTLKNKEMLMKLYHAHVEQKIDAHGNWPEYVKNLTKNVIWAQYKKYMKQELVIEFGD